MAHHRWIEGNVLYDASTQKRGKPKWKKREHAHPNLLLKLLRRRFFQLQRPLARGQSSVDLRKQNIGMRRRNESLKRKGIH